MPDSAAEVLAAFDAVVRALCERRDASTATALFAADDDVVMWGSELDERAVGPTEVAALHKRIAGAPARIAFRWEHRLVHVERDVGWVNASGEVSVEHDGEPPRRAPYRATAIMVRRRGGWRWHTFNGSEPTL